MPALNVQQSFSPSLATSAPEFAEACTTCLPLTTGPRGKGSSLLSLRFLLGLLALILSVVGLSGCGGGWGEFKPTITAEVQNQTVRAGQTATFTVAATGTGPITYQWYKNGTLVPNATSVKYAMVAQTNDDASKMSVGATNAGGTATSTGILTVQVPPTITTQPLSQKIVAGQTATFTVVAAGTAPLTYQWFQGGAPISGATSSSYTTPAITSVGANTYTVAISNVVGNVTSIPATLTVASAVPSLAFAPIVTQTYGIAPFPVSATSASNGAVTYAVVSGPATISGNTVTITGIGPVVLSASQVASGNYDGATATTNFTVNPVVPKLSFASIGAQTVGGAPFPVSATSASSGAVTYAVVSGPATVAGNMVTLTGSGPVVLSASQAANGNYAAATTTTTVSAGAQTAALTFAPIANQTFGVSPFPVSATSASNGAVTYSVTSGPATISGSNVTVAGVGTVVLGASQAASGSYNAATASTSFIVGPKVPTLAFAPIPTQASGNAPFTVNATSASSGTVTYSVVSGPATIAGSTVTLTGNGTVQLSASQAANGNYTAATATTNFNVGLQTPTLAFAPIAAQSFGNSAFPVSATSASPGAVTYTVASGPATLSGNTVTLTGTGTVVLTANQAASGNYAAAQPATTSFTVAAATPNLAFAPIGTQTAGGAPFMVSAASASNGAVTYTVVSGPATIAGNTVTVTGNGPVVLSATQAASGNYTVGTATTTFTAGAQTPTLAFAPIATQTYGNVPFTVSATSASPGAVTYVVTSGPATISGNTVTTTGTGTVLLTATQAASGTYAAPIPATASFTVNPATPTLAFAPIAAQTYGNPPITVSATSASSGAVTYSVVSGPATVSGNTVTTTGNGTVTLAANQAASINYTSATANTTFTVGTQTPTLGFAPIGAHNYGDAAFPVSATSASTGAVTYSVISGPATVSGSSVTVTGSGTVILGASQAAAGGYTTANATTTFTVGAETPALVFAPITTQTYGSAPIQVSATSASTGAVTYAVVSGPATVSGSTVTTTGIGNVILSASQAASGSYATAVATTNFNVVAATPTLAFAFIPAHTYGDAPFTVSATSASSGAVTYTIVSGPATISGNTVTLTGSGPVVLGANQAASGNYAAATAQTSLTAAAATPTLSFAPIGAHNFGDLPFTVSATSASSGAVTYAVLSGPATILGNTVTITGNGPIVLGASQAASGSYGTATAQANFTAGTGTPTLAFAPIPAHTYGDPAFTVSATSVSDGAVTYAVASGPATISGNIVTLTGIGTVTLTANQAASGNYAAPIPATTSFSVAAETPTLTFAPIPAQTFGGAPFKVSATSASGGAVTYSVVSGPATIAGNTVTVTGDGTITLGASQAANGNYTSATTSTFVNVGVATPTLTFAPVAAQTYGGAPFTINATSASSGAVTYTVASGPATISGNTVTTTGAGTVVINASQAPAPGYGGATTSTSVNVGVATPTLAFASIGAHTYGDAPFTVNASSASNGTVTYTVASGPATIAGNTVTLTGTGTVVLNASQAATTNYAAASTSANFSTGIASPTLNFAPIAAHTYGDAPFTVSATSVSNGAVTYSVVSGSATISGNTVTLTGTGNVVLSASQVATSNYASATASANFNVGGAMPTLTFAPIAAHTYGDAPFTVSATSASSGPVIYAVQSGPATISGNTVTLTGTGTVVLTANQAASGNYSAAAQATTNFNVGNATPTLTFAPIAAHSYGDAPFTVSATSASSGPVIYAVQSGPATISGNTVTLTGSGAVVLTANQAANGNYNAAAQVTTSFTVGNATPTLAFAPIANHTYGDAAFTVNATSASSGPVVYAVQSGPATISGNMVTLTGIGTVVLTANQAAFGNYNAAAQATTNFAVGAATPTLTFAAIGNKTYGNAPFTVSATSASTGAVTYAVVSGPATIAGNTITLTGVGPVVLSATQAAAGNYAAANASTNFTVGAASPTITLNVPNQTFGAAPFAVNATSNSAGAFTYNVVSGPATISGNTVSLTGAGTVMLGVSQAANGNYTAGSTTATFTVAPGTPALNLSVPNQTYGVAPFAVNATSPSPGALTYTVTSGPATVSGNTVTITGAGPVTLGVSQAATANYAAATTSATFTVAPATTAITFTVPNKTFGNAPFTVSASSASTGAFTYAVVNGPASIVGNTVTLTGAGLVTLSASQAATTNYTAGSTNTIFTVAGASPTIVFNIADHTYGDAPFTVNATSNSTGTFTYAVTSGPATISGNTVTLTGSGPVTLSATQAAAGNYTAGTASTTFQVAAKNAPITFVIPNKTYGAAPFAVNATSNSPGAFTYTVVSGPATVSGSTVTLTGAGTVVLKASQAASGGYAANSATASFNVAQNVSLSPITPANSTVAPSMVTFNATAQGGVTNTLTWSASAGNFVGSVWTSPNTVGTYTITATSVDDTTKSVNTTITVSKPVITQQPVSQNVCSNAPFSLSVIAKYAASYQWYLGTTALSGATSASYNIGSAQASLDAGNYTVQVSNPAGSVTSTVATVAVGSSIASQPANVSVKPTQTASFTVSVTGDGPFTYQWYKAASSGATGAVIPGATGTSYTTPAVSSTDTGEQFYVIVTDACGTALTSKRATLTVVTGNVPPTITQQPASTNAAIGGTATFSVTATGSPTLTYQWYLTAAGSTTHTAISGATSATYTVPNTATAASDDQDQYNVVVTNPYGTAVSSNAVLSVGSGITISQQPQTVYTNPGMPATYSVTASSTAALSYQWYEAAPGSSTFAAIAGATSSTYTQATTATSDTGSVFYVSVSNGSSTVKSSTAALFVGDLANVPNCSTTWNTVGDAQALATGCGYQLTAAVQYQHGDIVWPTLLSTGNLLLSFTVTTSSPSNPPADGYAVVFGDPSLGATLTSVGAAGQGLGAEGIPGLVVAFDDYYNPGDPQVPYIGVGRGEANLWENPYFYLNTAIPALAAQNTTISHNYVVSLVSGSITVTMDGAQVFSGQVNVPPVAYLYVTSSTGGYWEQTVVSNITATVNTP